MWGYCVSYSGTSGGWSPSGGSAFLITRNIPPTGYVTAAEGDRNVASITVKPDNPGKEFRFQVDDETFFKLFKDVSVCVADIKTLKDRVELIWRVILGGMVGGFGLLTALIVIL